MTTTPTRRARIRAKSPEEFERWRRLADRAKTRAVVWQLFIETMTRVTTQLLGAEEGFLREALNSVHNLFGTTRERLKQMSPTQVKEGKTVEMVAIAMLNEELRPSLSKWHPLLTAFEKNPDAFDRDWNRNQEFRSELSNLQQRLIRYARDLGTLANVSQLDDFIADTTDGVSEHSSREH